MVSFETIVSHRSFKQEQPLPMLDGLARGTAIALAVYLVARFADMAVRGNLGLIFSSGKASTLFLIEVVGSRRRCRCCCSSAPGCASPSTASSGRRSS